MSHFSVMVISKNPEDVELQLAPFIEQVEKGDDYAEFNSTEAKDKEEYETGGINTFYGIDMGDIGKEQYDELKENKWVHFENYPISSFITRGEPMNEVIGQFSYWVRGEGWHERLYAVLHNVNVTEKEVDTRKLKEYTFDAYLIPPPGKVPFTNLHKTFEDYEKNYSGYESRDEDTGEYGYWHNPNARWDWYLIGGRWNGHLMAKIGKRGVRGEGGLGSGDYKAREYDQIQYKDIDTEAMLARDLREQEENWDKLWEKAEQETCDFYDSGKADTREYPIRDDFFWSRFSPFSDIKKGITKEEYLKEKGKEHPLHTFAILTKDGEWLEKGKMGWWGMVSDEDKVTYEKQFEEVLNSIESNDWITIVDCHI